MSKVKCKHCKILTEKAQAYRTNMQTFCSVNCYMDYFNTHKKAKKKKPDNKWLETRATVIALDGGRCRVCGTKQNLHVHHIHYRSEGGKDDLDNLITLCVDHHELIHSNKNLYQPRCLEAVAERDTTIFRRIKIGE